MSFDDRFELLELLRDGDVQTFRARERATGRAVEVHLSTSPGLPAKLESSSVIDRGNRDGKFYVVTADKGLDSAGAWQVKAPVEPQEKAAPGDFTRMFELRQAPEPAPIPAAKVAEAPAPSQPGEFTRVFKKPATAPPASPAGSILPGGHGEFTRMFKQPGSTPSAPASPVIAPASAPKNRVPVGLIVTAIVIIAAIAVFALVRTLY